MDTRLPTLDSSRSNSKKREYKQDYTSPVAGVTMNQALDIYSDAIASAQN